MFSIIAVALAAVAPIWAVALCVPAAGLFAWVINRRHKQQDTKRLDRLTGTINDLGALAPTPLPLPGPGPGPGPGPAVEHPGDAIDRLGSQIARRNAHNKSEMNLLVEAISVLEANVNAVETPVIATDESGRISLINRAAKRLFAEHPSPPVGVRLEDLLTNNALIELHARARLGEVCSRQIRLTLEGTARFYEVAAVPVHHENDGGSAQAAQRAGVVLTIKDVHELAKTLKLRTDFAANASHELRTPIASLRAAIDTMQGPAENDPAMRQRLLGMLNNNVARLEEIVIDLLDLSHLESEGQPIRSDRFDGLEMADALSAMFSSACRKRDLRITFELDSRLRTMRTDRKLLLLILRNLIDNATKFAFEHTTIRVTGESVGVANPTDDEPMPGARFTVTDSGVGIPLKHQQRIFERFFQVDESRTRVGTHPGSGLGLAIVRHALRRLDGDIVVISVWQEGTTMTVEIPRCVEVST